MGVDVGFGSYVGEDLVEYVSHFYILFFWGVWVGFNKLSASVALPECCCLWKGLDVDELGFDWGCKWVLRGGGCGDDGGMGVGELAELEFDWFLGGFGGNELGFGKLLGEVG